MFIVAFVFDTVINEIRIKKYIAHSAELDSMENDLSDD